ncbi:hypothetical protein GCG54_00013319 [Colletotrichum gloeosporioides]|uniref:Uncharacterized protein n=1 Tax=Colletotrichum gloeosporioides TaxID=474922 RepID=A0A8H4CG01_COLGL|nr:uncharacterized protein GCG54_00013319 [Colletotrichum gloeosporioides]KAF3803213.1 hypothetical protein GCG54_00013319 [Colletotrichum gloeosporioides]
MAARLDDVPEIADTCKLILARTNKFLADKDRNPRVTDETWRPANWAITEVTRTIPKVKETIHHIRECADAERKKLPTINYTAWTQSMRRAPGDPYARGPPGDDVLINDIPRLADRFTALAERFRELEEKPYKRGDDVMAAYDHVNVVLMECRWVKKWLPAALDAVTYILTGEGREFHSDSEDSS